jgi:hypothetical protein
MAAHTAGAGLRLAGALAFGALVVVAACGGTAVVDGVNGDGGGTTTTGTATTGTTTTGTTTTTTTMTSACDEACDILASCSHSQDCVGPCQSQSANCSALHQQFVHCFGDATELGTCNYASSKCIDSLIAWAFDCEGWQTGNFFCEQMGPGGDCFCSFEVVQPPYFFEQYCFNIGGGQMVCDCFRSGDYTGTCMAKESDAACDPINGCCMAMNVIDLP